jgi:hypothetical protein
LFLVALNENVLIDQMKIYLLFVLSFLGSGAGVSASEFTPSMLYKSDPPGAYVSFINSSGSYTSSWTPVKIMYPFIKHDGSKISSDECIDTPIVTWPDGATRPSYKLCYPALHGGELIFRKPSTPIDGTIQRNTAPVQQSAINIDDAKKKCSDLGFKTGTEGFGQCVLKLSR